MKSWILLQTNIIGCFIKVDISIVKRCYVINKEESNDKKEIKDYYDIFKMEVKIIQVDPIEL